MALYLTCKTKDGVVHEIPSDWSKIPNRANYHFGMVKTAFKNFGKNVEHVYLNDTVTGIRTDLFTRGIDEEPSDTQG